MSVPAPRKPRQDSGRWETIRYALDSNARTFRLCLIWLVVIVAPVAAAVVADLVRHMPLREGRAACGLCSNDFGPGGSQPPSPSHQSKSFASLLMSRCP